MSQLRLYFSKSTLLCCAFVDVSIFQLISRTFRCIVTQKTTVGMLQYVKDPLEPDDLKGDLKGDLNGALTGERRDPLLEY